MEKDIYIEQDLFEKIYTQKFSNCFYYYQIQFKFWNILILFS